MRPDAGDLPPFGGDEAAAPFASARVAVLPVPYEATVSYGGGTSRGPEAILRASTQVELYDEQTRSEPFRAGVWTDAMLDVGGGSTEAVVRRIERRFGELMDAGKWVVMLGGEHSITPGGVAAAANRRDGLHVVQLDAHADLRQEYEGDRWSHACAMARCVDLGVPLTAVGIRNYCADEAAWIERGIPGYRIVHAWEMETEAWIERALSGLDGKPVYLTIDLDYFDPAIIPATGTPEPGGGTWWPTLRFLGALFARADVVGCDLVELAPVAGLHHADFTAARLAYKLVGLRGHPPFSYKIAAR
jgi:N1-aminopropylagmatine ureohydrolase